MPCCFVNKKLRPRTLLRAQIGHQVPWSTARQPRHSNCQPVCTAGGLSKPSPSYCLVNSNRLAPSIEAVYMMCFLFKNIGNFKEAVWVQQSVPVLLVPKTTCFASHGLTTRKKTQFWTTKSTETYSSAKTSFWKATLPETNRSHLTMNGRNICFLLGWPIFSGYVSFRECNFEEAERIRNSLACFKLASTKLEVFHPVGYTITEKIKFRLWFLKKGRGSKKSMIKYQVKLIL